MKYICSNCLEEDYIRKYIVKNGSLNYCNYCKKKRKIIEFEKVVEIIESGFSSFYDDPINGLGRINGEWVSCTSGEQDTYDLLTEYFDYKEEVFEDLVSRLPEHLWCKKDFYDLDDSEENINTWKSFIDLTKYKFRYLFNTMNYGYNKYRNPIDILKEIMNISDRLKLFHKIKKGTIVYRAVSGYHTLKDELCSPPIEKTCSNRFNPVGFSMFYGSADKDTCKEEIGIKKDYSVGIWEIQQDILIYDLTYKFKFKNGRYFYNKFPSIFDENNRKYYHYYKFILDFASDVSQKADKKKYEKIEYVPTQIITEYLKLNKKDLKGISYYSSINGNKNYCLFIDKQQCESEKIIKMVNSFYIK
jgi:hypothetical protein